MRNLLSLVFLVCVVACVAPPEASNEASEIDDDSLTANAATASAEIPPSKLPGGTAKQETVEIPLSVDARDGASPAAVIVCTVTAGGEYVGSGHNLAEGIVLCHVTVNSIGITFEWFNHNTGALMRVSGKPPCFNKSACSKADGFDSFAVLDVVVCATVVKAGFTTGYACALAGPF